MSLADRLAALTVEIADASVETSEVVVPGYVRPTSVLRIRGRDGSVGRGEHVAWSRAAHDAFRACLTKLDWPKRATVAELAARTDLGRDVPAEEARHRRAAVDGALIDLALRQANTSLAQIAGAAPCVEMRYVFSFEAMRAPAERVRAILRHNPSSRFKIDVDPDWDASELTELAALGCVEMLDGKGRGSAMLWKNLRASFGSVICEDAPHATTALDQSLLSLDDIASALDAGYAINVKAPRLGGFLVAIRALELAAARGACAYMGGMYEVGPGRRQARCLAALLSREAPDDLAPLEHDPASFTIAPSPLAIELQAIGF